MTRGRIAIAAAYLAATVAAPCAADDVLQMGEVLESSIRFAPRILESVERRRIAQGELLSAEGAFDRRLEADSLNWLNGFYDGRTLDSSITQPLRELGARIFAGYRVSDGSFPIYQDEYLTNSGGEFNAGIVVPVLRNRAIDAPRLGVLERELDVAQATAGLLDTQVRVQRDAMEAYWTWVAAGQRLAVFDQLVSLAEGRVEGFQVQFEAGDVAEIAVVENAQNLLRRRSLATNARRDFEVAAVALSLFYRDANGQPRTPEPGQLPPTFPPIDPGVIASRTLDLARALEASAALAIVEQQLAQARARVRLGENQLLPQVDLGVKLARDLGSGSPTRDGTDVIFEFAFSLPIERRQARGEIASAEADINRLLYQRQQLEETLRTRVEQLADTIKASVEFADIARLEVDQAVQLEEAERTRFREGASDFFLLNLREERTADARTRKISAILDYFRAVADYYAITFDTRALGVPY